MKTCQKHYLLLTAEPVSWFQPRSLGGNMAKTLCYSIPAYVTVRGGRKEFFREEKDVSSHWSERGRWSSGVMLVLAGGTFWVAWLQSAQAPHSLFCPHLLLIFYCCYCLFSYLIDFTINCSYPNPKSSPFVPPVLLSGHTWVEEGRRGCQ